jgi:ArsR family transcriptional regulator
MGLTKTEFYTEQQNRLSSIAKVLGHPARIAILQYLLQQNTCICGDLVQEIGLAQPTISQHLKELKRVDIIQGKIEGTSVCYCINQNTWNQISSEISTFFNLGSGDQSSCC